jgi:hypothetical protein
LVLDLDVGTMKPDGMKLNDEFIKPYLGRMVKVEVEDEVQVEVQVQDE